MAPPTLDPLSGYERFDPAEIMRRAAAFYAELRRRRTVRDFAPDPVPREAIEDCLRAAGTAPNGANMQPWHFVVVTDPAIKALIRAGAEKEEHEFYHHRAPREWLDALATLGTDEHKAFLETAPCFVIQVLAPRRDGQRSDQKVPGRLGERPTARRSELQGREPLDRRVVRTALRWDRLHPRVLDSELFMEERDLGAKTTGGR